MNNSGADFFRAKMKEGSFSHMNTSHICVATVEELWIHLSRILLSCMGPASS